jgi:LPS-assembly protein
MKNLLFKGIIVFAVILLSALNAFAHKIDIFADNLEYDEQVGKLFAKGNAIFNWEEKKVFADYIEFDKKTVKASGNVKVEESGTTIYADSVTYNYDEGTGHIDETFGYSSSAFIQAKSIEMQNKDMYTIKGIKLSKCDLDNPHTHFRAKHGKLELNKRLTIYNAIFYIGKVPVFYLPIFTKSLKGDKSFGSDLKIEFNPKFEGNSMYLNTVISCALSESLRGKFSADFLRKKRNSYGITIDYLTENANGNIDINETNNFKKWKITSNYLHIINSIWNVRYMAWFKSDMEPDNYHLDDGNTWDYWDSLSFSLKLYPCSNLHASVIRQGLNTNLNMSIMYKAYSDTDESRKLSQILFPKVELASYSRKIFLGIRHDFYFMYQNVYRQYLEYNIFENFNNSLYKNDSRLYYKLMRDFKFGNQFTLIPAIKIEAKQFSKDDISGQKQNGGFIINYIGSLNARFRVTDWMDWNVNYHLNTRTKMKSFDIETSKNDYGIEKNSLSFNNNMYFGESITVQNFFAYSLKQYRYPEENIDNKCLPFATEIMCTFNPDITLFLKQEQFINPFKFNSIKLDLTIGKLEKAYLNFGTFYQRYDKHLKLHRSREVDNILGVGIWLTPKWKLNCNIKTTISFDSISNNRINEYEFRIFRDLHCYNFSITWQKRADKKSGEFFFKFNAKTNASSDKKKAIWNLDDETFHS